MVENQNRKVPGYRDLTEEELQTIADIKYLEDQIAKYVNALKVETSGVQGDPRQLALARTHLEQGFMHLVKAVAKPTTVWQ